MGRVHVAVPVPALSLRRPEAAAALGLSVETFDTHVRPNVAAVRTGSVTTYPVAGLVAWLTANAGVVADDLDRRRAA
jgi:hypothetical protein